jgi:predicted transcriptional regulator
MHAITQQAPETVGGLIDELFLLREQRRKLAETDKNLQAQYAELEARLIAALDQQETTQARGRSATATLNEEELATVLDWSQVHEFIRSQNAFHLIQRRINSAAWRELATERGEPIPGTTVFKRRTIALRRL